MVANGKQFWYLYSALVLLVLIRIIPFLYPASRTWGFNHLLFLPIEFTFAFFVIAVVALIFPLLKISERWSEKFINWFSATFFECSKRLLYRAIFVSMMVFLFIIFVAPTHFLGDGYAVLNNISSDTGTQIKWSEVGIIYSLRLFTFLIDPLSEKAGELTMQSVSIVSGGLSVFLFFSIAHLATAIKSNQVFIFMASFLSGTLLLFFGYIEHYPIIWIFMLGMLYGGLHHAAKGKGLAVLWTFFILGTILHLQMLVFCPAVLYLTINEYRGRIYGRRFVSMLSIIIIAGSAGIAAIIYILVTDLYFQLMFVDLFNSRHAELEYTLLSVPHLLDILNEILLVSPILPVLLIILRKNHLKKYRENKRLFLTLASLGCLAFLFMVDPKLGMPRDWDLFSFTPFAITLLLLIMTGSSLLPVIKKMLLPLSVLLILFPAPYLITNLQAESSAKYSEYFVSLDMNRSMSSLFILFNYFEDHDDTIKADSLKAIYKSSFPRQRMCDSVIMALNRSDMPGAKSILSRIEPNEYDELYQRIMGRLNYLEGNYGAALKYINKSIQLRRYYSNNYGDRAKIFLEQGKYGQALADLRHGYSINNKSQYIIDGLINTFDKMGIYDSSIYYLKLRLAEDSTHWLTYYKLAWQYFRINDTVNTLKCIENLSGFKIPHGIYHEKLDELLQLKKQLDNNY